MSNTFMLLLRFILIPALCLSFGIANDASANEVVMCKEVVAEYVFDRNTEEGTNLAISLHGPLNECNRFSEKVNVEIVSLISVSFGDDFFTLPKNCTEDLTSSIIQLGAEYDTQGFHIVLKYLTGINNENQISIGTRSIYYFDQKFLCVND